MSFLYILIELLLSSLNSINLNKTSYVICFGNEGFNYIAKDFESVVVISLFDNVAHIYQA